MQGPRQWMWLGVCGLVWAGCAEPLGARLEQEPRRPTNVTVSLRDARTAVTPPVPPPVIWLSSTTAVNTLWSNTTSARKYVLLMAYTVPRNAAGVVGPPRFRAFGVDLSRNAYVFVVDGESQALLGAFTQAMLAQKALVITTPPGTTFDGACAKVVESGPGSRAARHGGVSPLASEDGGTEDGGSGGIMACGTEPVIRVPVTTGEGGDEDIPMNYDTLMDLPRALDTGLRDFQVPGVTLFEP